MEERITSSGFDFLGINTRIEEFGRKNMMSSRAIRNAQVVFEELCVQTLVPQMDNSPDMRITLEYSDLTDKATMNVFHNVNIDKTISKDELSFKLIENASLSIETQNNDTGEYAFVTKIDLKVG